MSRKLGQEVLIHVAGEWTPDLGQCCIVCGFELDSGLAGKAWEAGTEPPKGWATGALVLKDGVAWTDVTNLDPDDPDLAHTRRCQASDDPEHLEVNSWE